MKQGSQGEIVFKNAQLEVAKEAVKATINQLRKKWSIPAKGFQKSSEYKNWLDRLTRQKVFAGKQSPSLYSNFLQDITEIILPIVKKPRYWVYFFALYLTRGIIRDRIVMRSGNTPVLPKIKMLFKDNRPNLLILELNANTTLNDVKRVWDKVRALQKSLPDYESARTKRRLLEDFAVLEQKSTGKTVKEIYDKSIPRDVNDERSLEATHKGVQRLKKVLKGH